MNGQGMPQQVRMNVDAEDQRYAIQYALDDFLIEATTVLSQQEKSVVGSAYEFATYGEIVLRCGEYATHHRHDAVFVAFPTAHQHRAFVEVEVVDAEIERLRQTQCAAIEQFAVQSPLGNVTVFTRPLPS